MAVDFSELCTADIICYGAPLSVVFQLYLTSLKEHVGKCAAGYTYRGYGIPQGGSALVGSCGRFLGDDHAAPYLLKKGKQ